MRFAFVAEQGAGLLMRVPPAKNRPLVNSKDVLTRPPWDWHRSTHFIVASVRTRPGSRTHAPAQKLSRRASRGGEAQRGEQDVALRA